MTTVETAMRLPTAWQAHGSASLVEQLQRETPPGHVLHSVPVVALARRMDNDDVLFRLDDGTARVAVVHLTYASGSDPRWPATELFDSAAAWLASSHEID